MIFAWRLVKKQNLQTKKINSTYVPRKICIFSLLCRCAKIENEKSEEKVTNIGGNLECKRVIADYANIYLLDSRKNYPYTDLPYRIIIFVLSKLNDVI